MKNITLRLIVLLTTMLGIQGLVNAAPDPNFHIYICFGQSNMEGAGQVEQSDKVNVNERFKMMATVSCNGSREMGKWYTAVPPLARCNTGLSPADYFGRTLVEKLDENIKVGVIVVAVGGADIQLFEEDGYQSYLNTAADWLKNWAKEYDNNCYKRIIDMAKIAQQDGVIKGILVHQGETNNMQQNWPNRLKAIYENMLSDLNLKGEEVPLLVGETRRDGVCSGHNQVIANVPNVIPNSYVISSEGLEKTNDDYHFSAQGYRDFGKRYAEQMLKLLPANSDPQEPEQPEEEEPEEDLSNLPITGAKGGTNIYVNNRQVFVYAPQSIKSNRPLVISMHGMNQDINYQKQMCNWESIADTANFVVAYPSGENATWDCFGNSDKDTKYLIAIIDKMYEDYKIDRKRVYLSGFSMGGMMTYYCMNNIPDYFAAFAPISGYLFGAKPNPNTRPVPLFHTHGTGDDVVYFNASGNQEGAQAVVDAWKAHNNCTETTKVKVNNCTDRTIYSGGDCDVEVVLNAIPGRGHEPRNDNCHHTSLEIWKFVSKYTNECGAAVERPVVPQTPYNGIAATLPGKIEAEEFDEGGQNVSYYDKDTQNRNGDTRDEAVDMSATAIGYTEEGEWLEYTINIESAGDYQMEASVASGADGSSFKLYLDDEAITDVIDVPNTGDWETFVTVESAIKSLPEGEHILKLEITGSWLDMDYMNFKLVSQSTGMNIPLSDFWLENSECDVFSLLGQKIKTVNNRNELKDLPAGVYLLRNTQTQKVKKVVISE
jgi:poly(hydroxyalkanoate) depolymerase family esterase